MVNPFKEINWQPDTVERRKFALSLLLGFPIIGVLVLLRGGLIGHHWSWTVPLWLAASGAAVGTVLWLVPAIALPAYLVWYFLAACLGIVLSNALLAGFYYTFVTGVGLLLRCLGRRPLSIGINKSAPSYWLDAEKISDPSRYYSQF